MKALLRRQGGLGELVGRPARTLDGLEIDIARHLIRVDGAEVEVTALEFNLLAALAAAPGVVLTRAQLLERVWGDEFTADDHLVDAHVANLRRKLGDDPARPRFVETVRGVGYRLQDGER